MSITEPLVLPSDVTIVPVAQLARRVQDRLKANADDYALTRPQGRSRAKLVDAEGASLLEEFRSAKRVADGIIAFAARKGLDPEAVLRRAFPLLRDCFNAEFLVPASSPRAAPILATRERGDRISGLEVLRCVQLRDDTELYQCRNADGLLAAVKLARPGAVKTVAPQLEREADTLLRLAGAGAPALLGRGRHRGRPWIATTWCAGVSPRVASRELREDDAPGSRRRLLSQAVAIARRYARLHARRILHGDVHPDNLLIDRAGGVTLLDFGLAEPIPPLRLRGRAARGAVAAYLSPEQADAALGERDAPAPTPASEQYALGAVLYALFTGHSYAEFALEREPMLRQILGCAPLPFARRGVTPWPALERVLARALAKDPADRFPSVTAMVAALQRATPPRPSHRSGRDTELRSSDFIDQFLARVHYSAPAFREWPRSALLPAPTASVMFGAAGVAYALYRLACLREQAAPLALADAWLCRAEQAEGAPDAFTVPGTDLTGEILGPVSPYHSMTGVHVVRALLALATGERRVAERAAGRFAELSRTPWSKTDVSFGKAGTLLAAALLLEALRAGGANPDAIGQLGGESLHELWQTVDWSRLDNPGVAHGWAGILYASLRWCRAAATPLPADFSERLRQLAARAEPLGRGVYWPLRSSVAGGNGRSGEVMSGWCNGPAGFIHLWTLAHEQFQHDEYLALAEASAWSAWEGRGSLPDLCCGLAGRAYGLLNLYRHTGATVWLERARKLADRAVRGVRRTRGPRPLSLYKGEPGIVLLVADLIRPESASMLCFEPEGWPRPSPVHD